MYDTISRVFLAIFAIAYLAFLAALAWWALGGRLRSALKSNVILASFRARRTVRSWVVQSQGKEVKFGTSHPKQLRCAFVGSQLEALESELHLPARFLLNSDRGDSWRHCSVEANGDTGSSLR